MTRLKETYQNEIVDAMTKKFGYKNVMQVPKLAKIVVNMAIGEAKENSKILDTAMAELETRELCLALLLYLHRSLSHEIPSLFFERHTELENSKILDTAMAELETITGQKAVPTKAKKSIANFKLREGMPIGCMVTLRGDKMERHTELC